MEHKENIIPAAATDEPAVPSNPSHALALTRDSDRLTESLISDAIACSGDSRPGWSQRIDGWTPDRICTFLTVLSQCGVVADAARAVGLSQQSAYAFRSSPKGRAFDIAWRAAIVMARRRVADLVMSRAINGVVDVIVRDGKVWGERHRYDNRLTMAVLTRLDTLAKEKHQREEVLGAVAQEFSEFVDKVCEGGEAAADFIRSRCRQSYTVVDEAEFLDRAENYMRTGHGLPEENEDTEEDEAGDYDYFEEEEDEQVSSDPSCEPLAKEGGRTNGNIQFHQLYPASRPIPPRACLGEGDHPQVGGGALATEDDVNGEDLFSEALAKEQQPQFHQLYPPLRLQDGGGGAADVDHPKEGGEAGGTGVGVTGSGTIGPDPEPHPEPSTPITECPIPNPQPQWVLGDDGLPVRTVNGKLPPHHHRRNRLW